MNKRRIMVVEDDENILELIRHTLLREGYQAICYSSGEKLLLSAALEPPALIILDLMLPGIQGLEACRLLKQEAGTRDIPIVIVTAKGEERDVVAGLESGADDYLTKPFSPKVLTARIKAVLRRKAQGSRPDGQDGQPIRIHDLTIDPRKHKVEAAGTRLDMTPTEFQILYTLARRPGQVFHRYQIVESIRGSDYHVTDRAVDVAIFGLRKKLGVHGRFIETVRGVGYRLAEEEIAAEAPRV
ncbi:MAG: response regulator [Spirochaetales bacterium]|nr:response regulator [Spirochaetales bacterium]